MKNFFKLIFNKSTNSFPKISPNRKYFRTNHIGGLYVDVESLVKSEAWRWPCKMENWLLKNLIIRDDDVKITNSIILVSNFGIVDNVNKLKKTKDHELSEILFFEFKHAKDYIIDSTGNFNRINSIEKMNNHKFYYYTDST